MQPLVGRYLLFLGVFFLSSCSKQDDSLFDIGGFYVANELVLTPEARTAFLHYALSPTVENKRVSQVHVIAYIYGTNIVVKSSGKGISDFSRYALLVQTGPRRFALKPEELPEGVDLPLDSISKIIEEGNVEIEQLDRSTIKFSLTMKENGKDVKIHGYLARTYPTTQTLLLLD